MRNYAEETEKRVQFIRQAVADAHADGILFGNSGGKDSALVGILCKMACENTEGIILPCSSKRNLTIDKDDGMEVAEQFGIKTRVIDLTAQKELAIETMSQVATLSQAAIGNLAPRLRMLTLYAIGASENRLVAGTGNASEYHMGYFTKWGDGAYDLNPIADTVTLAPRAPIRWAVNFPTRPNPRMRTRALCRVKGSSSMATWTAPSAVGTALATIHSSRA